ncbi:MAG: hypothetical protein ACI8W7_002954 [Gammaproteobacteria bacterium]
MPCTIPAWREVYSTILDQFISRFTGYWAAQDWLEQIGEDPRCEQYPQVWYQMIPPTLRGQFNAQAALAEAMREGAWARLFNEPNLRKFVESTATGVDFPNVCLSQAVDDVERRCLVIATDKGLPAAIGKPTSFPVTNVDPGRCTVVADGVVSDQWRVVEGDIEVSTTVGEHTFVVRMS